MPDQNKKTEIPEDLREIRRKRQAARNQNRVQKVRRMVIILAVLAAVLVLVLIVSLVKKHRDGSAGSRSAGEASADGATSEHTASEVLHLSFPRLVMSDGRGQASTGANVMTVDDFNQILEQLYQKGYVLVDLTTLAERDDNGLYHEKQISLPGGKKPLVLSQRDVHYTAEDAGSGYATGLSLAEDGGLVNDYKDSGGVTRSGPYDLVTCVETFIGRNPDFSYDGARGILALTGADGVLGYQDPAADDCQKVIDALFALGWKFASYSFDGVSYGTEQSLFEKDAKQWQEVVAEEGVGRTEIVILPGRADIGSRAPYTEDNEKFHLLSDQGFRWFCIDDPSGMTWMQTGSGFVRQGMHEVNSLEQFTALMENGVESFTGIRDAEEQQAALTESGPDGEDGMTDSESENGNPDSYEEEDDGEVDIIEETPI